MGVTEDMIFNVVSQYPQGIRGNQPLFDDLLGVGSSGRSVSGNQGGSFYADTGSRKNTSDISGIVMIAAFVILKFFMGRGWIFSAIVALVVGGLISLIEDMPRR